MLVMERSGLTDEADARIGVGAIFDMADAPDPDAHGRSGIAPGTARAEPGDAGGRAGGDTIAGRQGKGGRAAGAPPGLR
ncbi:MAG: hypothetical protein OXH59_20030 [Rhodospirillaceae bacterium]|nr:hypothetical protein [Rhodospirillaceae bacterium]